MVMQESARGVSQNNGNTLIIVEIIVVADKVHLAQR